VKKAKAIWVGKWSTNKAKPLQLESVNQPVKILVIYFSYDENKNKHFNFNLKNSEITDKTGFIESKKFDPVWKSFDH